MSVRTTMAAVACVTLAACGGSSHSQSGPVPVAAPNALARNAFSEMTATAQTIPADSGKTLSTMYRHYNSSGQVVPAVVNGTPNQFTPAFGNTSTGGKGPANTSFDGVPCYVTMSSNYHIHAFVGLYVNGQEIALPAAVGAVNPKLDPNGDFIGNGSDYYPCLYSTHTHDSTGIIHVEDLNGGVAEKPPVSTKYTTGQLFAVWGITVSANGFGQFSGPVQVFTSGQQYRGFTPTTGRVVSETTLQPWTGDPNAIAIYDHEVIWFLVGPTYPSSLPNVWFSKGY